MTIPVLVEPDDIRWGHSFKKGQTCTKRSQLERPGAFETLQVPAWCSIILPTLSLGARKFGTCKYAISARHRMGVIPLGILNYPVAL